jgi:hypothetical protein
MRIGSPTSVERPAGAARQVEPQRTPVTRADLRAAIGRALERTDGKRPADELVNVLTAHASLETASGDRMYNFNFGGIKGASASGATAVCRTHEVLGGKDVVIKDGFRAYGSLDEGALDYVRTMKSRFSGALAPAARGDVTGFASALKQAHYYTASEADYARGLNSLIGAPMGQTSAASATSGLAAVATNKFGLSTAALSRVSDSLDAERWLGAVPTSLSGSPSHAHKVSEDEDDS